MTKDAPIILCEYNRDWPHIFEKERELIETLIPEFIVGGVEHVGSTAIPDLCAKPVIDIMVGVKDLDTSKPAIAQLKKANYCYYPYKPDEMLWFCKPSPTSRTHHLHLIPFNSTLWHQRLRFRDALRANKPLAAQYAELKQTLADRFAEDREAYTQAKTTFIMDTLRDSTRNNIEKKNDKKEECQRKH